MGIHVNHSSSDGDARDAREGNNTVATSVPDGEIDIGTMKASLPRRAPPSALPRRAPTLSPTLSPTLVTRTPAA